MAEEDEDVERGSSSPKTIHVLLDIAIKCPKQQQSAIEELVHVLKTTDFGDKCLKTTLAFHKSFCPIAVVSTERRLFARGVLSEEDITKPSVSFVLSKILFEVVTASSTECAEYCANVWLERVEAQHRMLLTESTKLELPNPMNFLKRENLESPGFSILASLGALTTEQRRMSLLECTALLEIIPYQFYSRVTVGLFCFLEFYESQLNMDSECTCLPELEHWVDKWMHLLASSLLGKLNSSQHSMQTQLSSRPNPSAHHILCAVMVASHSFMLLKSYTSTSRKVLKGFDQLILSSSGFTSTWLKAMKFYFEF